MILPISENLELPQWIRSAEPSAMEKLLSYGTKPGFISFALGLPAIELFPVAIYKEAINEMIDAEINAFQYTPPIDELKKKIVEIMRLRGVTCSENQILLTSGAQQGINLLVRLLLDKGDKIILEELAYPGILQTVEPYQPEILTVATDPHTGIDVDHIEAILNNGQKPAFIYIVTDGGNPRAVSIELSKRIRLAELANKFGVPIIEDDPYGFLKYEQLHPPLKHYGGDWIFYVGSFSKILAPSLRTGWIVIPEWLISRVASLKESSDINTATFAQRTINSLLKKNIFIPHIKKLCDEYKRRRDCMVAALNHYLSSKVNFHVPENGIFLWVDFHKTVNTTKLLEKSIHEENVAFIPSEAFSATKNIRVTNGVRLNFSRPSAKQIQEGIERIAKVINQFN